MTVEPDVGYTWTDGKHARIMHEGLSINVASISAVREVSGYPATAVGVGNTVDRWRPFSNELGSPTDLSDSTEWNSLVNATIGSDGQTYNEGTSASTSNYVQQPYTFSAGEYVVGVILTVQNMDALRLNANDGTTAHTVNVDLRDCSIISTTATDAAIAKLPDGRVQICMTITAAAGTGFFRIQGADISTGTYAITYTGTSRTVKIHKAVLHLSGANLDINSVGPEAAEAFFIGGHNLGNSQGRLVISHDSDEDGTYTAIKASEPVPDNSPIYFAFDAITSRKWRLRVSEALEPEIAIVRIGTPLVMQRPFYSGHTPTRMNRQTEVTGNLSGTGQLLGRSKQRTLLQSEYTWTNLTYSWVRDNLDGPDGLLQRAEDEPIFVAWRPELTEDVDLVMRASAQPPDITGPRDLCSFTMGGEVLSYE